MRLTYYSDYSLRVLIYLASGDRDRLVNIKDISEAYGISKNHLMKIIHNLGRIGYIETIRGRNGGIRLARLPADINVGEVVRKTEEDFYVVECFDSAQNQCVISPVCTLKHVLNEALEQFLKVLDQYTIQDMIPNAGMLQQYFATAPRKEPSPESAD
ncbi:Rrf2 family transcriptional regulator [Peribacillus sp. SCS-26]|uniref:Rrf2 family transcriptional regulator n=1 Tax=Paraperibacillus marinus TaxID=3115295 RepID=UPI00390587D6